MYTKNPQIRISLLNNSHSSINLSFDVLDGLFRQCPLYFNMLTAGTCTTVLLLWEKIHFLKCYIFNESRQILVTQVLIFGSSPHCAGKCMLKLYAVYIAGAWQSSRKKNRYLNCQLISNSVIQIHSFCLIRYYASLALIVLALIVGEANGQDFFLPKTIGFDFLLFNYMLLST